jgi:hypothetical protein
MPQSLNDGTPNSEPEGDSNFENAFNDAARETPASPPPASSAQTPAPGSSPPNPAAGLSGSAPPAAPPAAQAFAPPAAPPPAAPPSVPSVLDRARAAGLPLDGIDNEGALAGLLLERLQQMSPYVQLGQRYLTEQPGQQPAAQPEAEKPDEWTPEKYFAEKWNAPEWDPKWDFLIEKGLVSRNAETGLWEAGMPGAEAMVMPYLGALNQADEQRRSQVSGLFQGNPYQNFYEVLREPMERAVMAKVEELLGQRFSQVEQMDSLSKFENDNRSWLFDQSGQYSEHGQRFIAQAQQLQAAGITDLETVLKLTTQLVPPPAQQPQGAAAPAQPAAPGPNAGKPRDEHGRFVTAPQTPPAAPPTPQEAFLQRAQQRASHSPSSQGYAEGAPGAPVNLEQHELETLFENQWRAQKGNAAA